MTNGKAQGPRYDRVVFPRSFIELCVAQVRYPPLARFGEPGHLTLLREALAEEYPLVTSEQAMNVNIGPQGISSAPIEVLRFTTLDKAWAAILTGESVALEVRRYTEIGDFASRYASILSLVDLHLKPRFQVRFN